MHVVLLLGSSTAGKSSLCRELVATHQWNSGSVDESYEKILNEQVKQLYPLLLEKLIHNNLMMPLQSLMTEEDILGFAGRGNLTITKGNHQFTYQFQNPALAKLEEILIKAGFNENEIPELANNLRLTTKVGEDFFKDHPFPDPMERLYDETFNKNNAGQSIVLDVVPNHNSTAQECLKEFEQRAIQYREKNPGETLTTSVVFAYCPPLKLSERIQQRNRNAELDNPIDMRVGLFPFYQLASLVTADKKFDPSSENILSRDELFSLINTHANTDKIGTPVFLENPFDAEALHSHEDKAEIITIKDNVIKLIPDNDKLQLSSYENPRIGSKKTIKEYSKLAHKFGFFENQERASLNIPSGISFDAMINTAKGNPASLAIEFVEKLEKNKSHYEPICTL